MGTFSSIALNFFCALDSLTFADAFAETYTRMCQRYCDLEAISRNNGSSSFLVECLETVPQNIHEDAFCLIFTCTSFHQISSMIHRIFTSKELEDHWIIGHNGQQESSISNWIDLTLWSSTHFQNSTFLKFRTLHNKFFTIAKFTECKSKLAPFSNRKRHFVYIFSTCQIPRTEKDLRRSNRSKFHFYEPHQIQVSAVECIWHLVDTKFEASLIKCKFQTRDMNNGKWDWLQQRNS